MGELGESEKRIGGKEVLRRGRRRELEKGRET